MLSPYNRAVHFLAAFGEITEENLALLSYIFDVSVDTILVDIETARSPNAGNSGILIE